MQTRVHGIAFSRAGGDRLAAVAADAVGALLDAPQRFFDRLQDLGVGLLQLQLDVDFVVAAAWSAMSPWRVLFSIDACSGLMPPVAEDLGPFSAAARPCSLRRPLRFDSCTAADPRWHVIQ